MHFYVFLFISCFLFVVTENHLSSRSNGLDYDYLGNRSNGYSGADIYNVCKEAAMIPMRRLMKQLMSVTDESEQQEIDSEIQIDPVTMQDVMAALACNNIATTVDFSPLIILCHCCCLFVLL